MVKKVFFNYFLVSFFQFKSFYFMTKNLFLNQIDYRSNLIRLITIEKYVINNLGFKKKIEKVIKKFIKNLNSLISVIEMC